jgi:hypothetical protein
MSNSFSFLPYHTPTPVDIVSNKMIASMETDHVQTITLSDDERRKGKYPPLTLQKALEAMHQDGLVVLKGVIDVKHIDALNEKMCAEADQKRADPDQIYNHAVKCASPDALPT